MENLELRIQKLEKKYRTLKYSVLSLMCFAAYAGLSGTVTVNSSAHAQQQQNAHQAEKEAAGVPTVVEAEVFLLKDSAGTIRGIWSADDNTTSFAMMHKDKNPIIAMAVDHKNASLSLTDVYGGKISVGLNDAIRSLAITDETKKNNIYLGLTGSGAAAFDLISTNNAAVVIDGLTSSIDMSGDTSILALSETVGGTVALKAQPSSSVLTFFDYQNTPTATLSTVDGKTQLYMNSPASKEEKTLGTSVSAEETANAPTQSSAKSAAAEPENGVPEAAAPEKKEENKVVNMKTYSPFSK
ncbi:MAG: hypothetical protein IKR09_02305 [Alphaproteobacteria bacterium]|nr:hypothetical protein [Alphaproteobacteria bacterium]